MRLAALTTHAILSLTLVCGDTAWAQTAKWIEKAPAGDWRTTSMRDRSVMDRNGEEVGRIDDFLVGAGGNISAVIIDIGRVTQQTNSRIAVPFDQLQIAVPGLANAEDLARGGTAPKTPAEPQLSGPQGSSVAGAVKKTEKTPAAITLPLTSDEIRKAPRFEGQP